MTATVLILLAGLMGAAGIGLAAASAHAVPGAGLDTAGNMLLFHAPAVIAVGLAAERGLASPPLALVAAAGLVLGAALFSGDLALRAFTGHRMFPIASPTGGLVLIASWLLLAVAALLALWRAA
jgi:uncharacterized membrane protein YgdD (TMEM256/DUF423 family)